MKKLILTMALLAVTFGPASAEPTSAVPAPVVIDSTVLPDSVPAPTARSRHLC
jgi:hypothetical protein